MQTNFLEYHGVIAAVKHWLQRADIPLYFFKLQAPTIPISVVKLIKNKKGSKEFYLTLMSPKSQTRAPRGTDRSPEYNEHFCYKLDSRVKKI